MKKVLIFIAAGNSTRMGGQPKALLNVGEYPILINTINIAESLFDKIYIVSNTQNLDKFRDTVLSYNKQVEVFDIKSGQGDADAILKALNRIQNLLDADFDATICWGDVYFTSSEIFHAILNRSQKNIVSAPIFVGCSIDENPYAYFDIYTDKGDWTSLKIKKSYFRKNDGEVIYGMHDQCIFRCISSVLINVLCKYQQYLGYDGSSYKKSEKDEMGLLNSFEFMKTMEQPAQIILLSGGYAYSFNTEQELDLINKQLERHI